MEQNGNQNTKSVTVSSYKRLKSKTKLKTTIVAKKSLRIIFQNQKAKKRRTKYVYPRTVEAAKDPFDDATGKNKMFFVIAVNLFPDSKIIQPSDSESDTDEDEEEKNDWLTQDLPSYSCANYRNRSQIVRNKAFRRRHMSSRPQKKAYDKDSAGAARPHVPNRLAGVKKTDRDTAWMPFRPRAPVRRRRPLVNHVNGASTASRSICDSQSMADAINSVAENYSRLNSSVEIVDSKKEKESDHSFEIEKEM